VGDRGGKKARSSVDTVKSNRTKGIQIGHVLGMRARGNSMKKGQVFMGGKKPKGGSRVDGNLICTIRGVKQCQGGE